MAKFNRRSANKSDHVYDMITNRYHNSQVFHNYDWTTEKLLEQWEYMQSILAENNDPTFRKMILFPRLGPTIDRDSFFNASIGNYEHEDVAVALFSETLFPVADALLCCYTSIGYLTGQIQSKLTVTNTKDQESQYQAIKNAADEISKEALNCQQVPGLDSALDLLSHVATASRMVLAEPELPIETCRILAGHLNSTYPHSERTNASSGIVRFLVAGHELSHYLLGHLKSSLENSETVHAKARARVDWLLSNYDNSDLADNQEIHCDVLSVYLFHQSLIRLDGKTIAKNQVFREIYYAASALMNSLNIIGGEAGYSEPANAESHPAPNARLDAIRSALITLIDDANTFDRERIMVDGLWHCAERNIRRRSKGEPFTLCV